MSKHTPGPWYGVGAWVEVEDDGVADICSCNPDDFAQGHLGRNYDEMCANARLIAAAPDMLEALMMCDEAMAYISEYDIPLMLPELVKFAIAKAKGE
jgi:hypothetical protein